MQLFKYWSKVVLYVAVGFLAAKLVLGQDILVIPQSKPNAQTGTSYTVVDGDRTKLVTTTNGSAIAITLPQAGASGLFLNGWFVDFENRGVGTATITPGTSTIDGAASLALTTNQGVRVFSDGTNYFTMRGIGSTSGGTGNAASVVNTTFSATPTFTCPSSSAGTVTDFKLSTALTTNITSSTLASCTTGQLLVFWFTQDGTGGRTVVWPTGFSQAPQPSPILSTTTKIAFAWDGTTAQLIGASVDSGPSVLVTQAAPSVNPPSGSVFTWADSTNGTIGVRDSSGNIYWLPKQAACTNQVVTALASTGILTCTSVTGAMMTNNTVTSTQMAVVNTRRVCDIAVGDTTASAITNAQLGPQSRICYIPAAVTIVELDVNADAGTPNVIVGRNRAGSIVNIVSSALATAGSGGIACSNTGGTTGINGATTCTNTLQNTGLNAGDYLELVSGTAGGTAKFFVAHVIYTIN